MKLIIILLYLFIYIKNVFTESFIYPVAFNEIEDLIYIIHQKTPNELELLLYNYDKETTCKTLLAHYVPSSLKLLPSRSSFSFIDQGRLRIKSIQKRSPKALEFFEPISDINIINWIDDNCCYFSARKNLRFAIFEANIHNCQIKTIIQRNFDCLYPQKVNENLFYIERSESRKDNIETNNYKIIKTNYFENNKQKGEIIYENDKQAIAFLNFISLDKGFFIEHDFIIDRKEKYICFKYYYIFNEFNIWSCEELFSFSLPLKFIFGNSQERLYESIMPFLPRYIDGKIYFSSCTTLSQKKDLSVNLFCFDIQKKQTKKIVTTIKEETLFPPIKIKNKLFYGFSSIESQDYKKIKIPWILIT